MFPFPIVLIGLSEKIVPNVKDELAKLSATVETEYRGADTAIEGLRASGSGKKVLFVHFETAKDALWVRRLVEAFGDWPIVALVETADEPDNLLFANRAGAMQLVPLPLLDHDLQQALNCIALQFGPHIKNSRLIAVTGAAAGCGTTMVATNTAYEIAVRKKRRTILIELAHQMGVLATNLDIEPARTLGELLADPAGLDLQAVQQALVQVADNFSVLVGGSGVGPREPIPVAGVLRVFDYARRLAEVVVVDVPCTYTDFQFEVLGAVPQIVLVGEQSIASIRTIKLILDAVKAGPAGHSFEVVLNRYESRMAGLTTRDLEKTLGLTRIRTIPDDHARVLTAVNQGLLLRQAGPESPVLAAIDSLVDALLGKSGAPADSNGQGFFHRLFHSFSKQ